MRWWNPYWHPKMWWSVRSDGYPLRLKAKTKTKADAILRCVELLLEDPRHPGLRTSKMGGTDDVWEARASRGDRVTFRFGSNRITLLNHCNHDLLR